jgi:predicted trehalose synthase
MPGGVCNRRAEPMRRHFGRCVSHDAPVRIALPRFIRRRHPTPRAGLWRARSGTLHLGHVLFTGKDFVVTDFQGLEALTLTERRRKRSPLRDLAWMVGSFELAAFKRLLDPASVRESDVDAARP